MVTDIQVSLGFIVVFLAFIHKCREFFILAILSMVIALIGIDLTSYFVIPESVVIWFQMVFAMIGIYGVAKSIHMARKAFRKGRLLMDEVY